MSSSGGRWRGALEFSTLRRLTIYSPRHAGPVLLSQGFAQCNLQFVSILVGPEPSDRTIRLAKTSRRCGAGCDLLPLPRSLSGIAAAGTARPSVTTASACDSTGSPTRQNHSDRAGRRAGATRLRLPQRIPGQGTSGRFWRCRGSGPSRRTLRRSSVCREVGILAAAGCHEDGRSRRATFRLDAGGADGGKFGHRRGVGLGREKFRCLGK